MSCSSLPELSTILICVTSGSLLTHNLVLAVKGRGISPSPTLAANTTSFSGRHDGSIEDVRTPSGPWRTAPRWYCSVWADDCIQGNMRSAAEITLVWSLDRKQMLSAMRFLFALWMLESPQSFHEHQREELLAGDGGG